MYCPKCGGVNDDSAKFCNACGADLRTAEQPGEGLAAQPAAQSQPAYQQPVQQPVQQQPPYQPPYQAQQYRPAPAYGSVPRIPSYMGWAIAVLILCFWPTGIAAVVYASQVNNRLALGDVAGAQESSRKAKTWCWVSFGVAIAVWVIVIIVWVVAAATVITIY